MLSQRKIHSLVFGAFLLLPTLALSAVLTVNAPPGPIDSLNLGDSVGPTAFNLNQTVNGDNYNLTGTYSTSYTATGGTFIGLSVNAAYLGSSPTASADTLTVDVFQNFFNSSPGNWDGTYPESSGDIDAGPGRSVSVQAFWGGQALPLLGPYSSPTPNKLASGDLIGLNGDTLTGELQVTFDFAAGTNPGASASSLSVSSAVPEPGFMPVGFALLGAGAFFVRKRAAK
jgi:hypothetical protein